jgi:hypothetical protein
VAAPQSSKSVFANPTCPAEAWAKADAKRAAAFGAFLRDEILEGVGFPS